MKLYPKTIKFIFLLFLLPLKIFSQDLSGIWVGTIATSETQMPMELAINQDMSAYLMIVFTFKGTENVAIKKTTIVQKNGIVSMEGDKLIYDNFTTPSRRVKAFCELSIKMIDTTMVLSGPFHTRTRDQRVGDEGMYLGTITLQKQNNLARTKLIAKLDSLKLSNTISFSTPKPNLVVIENPVVATVEEKDSPIAKVQSAAISRTIQKTNEVHPNSNLKTINNDVVAIPETPDKDVTTVKVQQTVNPAQEKKKDHINTPNTIVSTPSISIDQPVNKAAAEIALRKTEVIRSIDFKADSLVLVLYDNGIVDGDTVSVVLNGEVVIPKQGLSEKAYRKVIKTPAALGDSLLLVMYAENLGSIPPNTGLLIVEDGPDRQEIRFEGDMKKSSAVVLRRKR
ncbi:MAG: hypothetical protein JST96_14085 [Bacteroidetes bacterium]|nr:hypothetical protein [Bacteroidota bacterium]